MTDRVALTSVMQATSAQVIRAIMEVCFPDATTVVDATYGAGLFWRPAWTRPYSVVGVDLDPARPAAVVGDFRQLDCSNERFHVGVFDPPYLSNPGRGRPSTIASRYGGYPNARIAEETVRAGAREIWRVSRLGVIIKVQNHIHGQKFTHMTRWIEEEIPVPLYDEVHAVSPSGKITDPKWENQFSVRHNHATYLIFRRGSQYHRGRRRNGR
jgi:hypothetical protein